MRSFPVVKGRFLNHVNFFDLKVSQFQVQELRDVLEIVITTKRKITIFGHGLGYLIEIKRRPYLLNIVDDFDIMVTDGRYFYLLLRLFGIRIKTEMSIPSLVSEILKLANEKSFSVLLLGASEDSNLTASENIRREFPNIKVHNGINGYYSKDDESRIVEFINQMNPDILLIGMNTPKKEDFCDKWGSKVNSRIIIPCGGMIDVLAGKTKQTPPLMKKLGLATAYRMFQEPKRLFVYNMKYAYEILLILLPKMLLIKLFDRIHFSFREYYKVPPKSAIS